MKLFIYWEYLEWICTYTENTQNAHKVEYLGKLETKIESILGRLLGPQMGSFSQITLSQKISGKCTFKANRY